MEGLSWSWLAAPYVLCAAAFTAVGVAAALTRGDRVMRLGMVGAVVTALPWALCQGLAAMANDAVTAEHLLRLGQGPVALIGPNILLLLLAVGGQLERFRWVARLSGVIGAMFLVLTWTTTWIVPGVQRLSSGMFYMSPGPLSGVMLSQLVLWFVLGLVIVRRSTPRADQRSTMRLLLGILVLGAVTSVDTLTLYGIWGGYPIAWMPALAAAIVALYLVLRTDLVRPQGLDRGLALELATFVGTGGAAIVLALFFVDSPLTLAVVASIAWAGLSGLVWGINRARPVVVAEQRSLEQFAARVATLEDGPNIAERLATLWLRTIGIRVVATKYGDGLDLAPELATWLARNPQPLAVIDMATMQLRDMRKPLEALGGGDPAGLIIPLVDRDELVGYVDARYAKALRDAERELVVRIGARRGTRVDVRRAGSHRRTGTRDRARGRGCGCAALAGVGESRCRARPMECRRRISNRGAHDRCGLVCDRARRWATRVARDGSAGARSCGGTRDCSTDRCVRGSDHTGHATDHTRRAGLDHAGVLGGCDSRRRAGFGISRDPRSENAVDRVGVRGASGCGPRRADRLALRFCKADAATRGRAGWWRSRARCESYRRDARFDAVTRRFAARCRFQCRTGRLRRSVERYRAR